MANGIKKALALLGRELHSRGSTQIGRFKEDDHLFGPVTGSTVRHNWAGSRCSPVPVHACGGFSPVAPAGDFQSVVSIPCRARGRLLVPVIAFGFYLLAVIIYPFRVKSSVGLKNR